MLFSDSRNSSISRWIDAGTGSFKISVPDRSLCERGCSRFCEFRWIFESDSSLLK